MTQQTQVIPFGMGTQAVPVPDYIAAMYTPADSNIPAKESIPSLSFKGKQFRIRMNGEETVLTKQTEDGQEPITVMKVVILDINPKRSRAMYEGTFDPNKNQAPVCWSSDGETPDMDTKTPKAAKCAACPFSVKGSRVTTDGKQTTACQQFKAVAVVPSKQPDFQPLRLRIPPTSLWDKDNAAENAQGWFAFDQYMDNLRRLGVPNTAVVVTKIKFDANPALAHPKLLFSAEGWVDGNTIATVNNVVKTRRAEIDDLIGINVPVYTGPAPIPVAAQQPVQQVVQPVQQVAPQQVVQPVQQVAPQQVVQPVQQAVQQPVQQVVQPVQQVVQQPVRQAVQPVAGVTTADVNAVLSAWDD